MASEQDAKSFESKVTTRTEKICIKILRLLQINFLNHANNP